MLAYGGDGQGTISAEKQADIGALRDEVDQIRSIMNQLRYSGASSGSQPRLAASPNEQRSSLLSFLSKVREQTQDKGQRLTAEERTSMAEQLLNSKHSPQEIKAFFGDNLQEMKIDDWQPNLQMFESMISAFSQQASNQGEARQSQNLGAGPLTVDSLRQLDGQSDLVEERRGGFNIRTNYQGSFSPEDESSKGVAMADDTFGARRRDLDDALDITYEQNKPVSNPGHARADSKGRQNAKARLVALKQSKYSFPFS